MGYLDLCAILFRRRAYQIIKTALLLFTVSFLWLQLRVANIATDFFAKESPLAGEAEVAVFLANFTSYSAHHRLTKNATLPPPPFLLRRIVQKLNLEQEVR